MCFSCSIDAPSPAQLETESVPDKPSNVQNPTSSLGPTSSANPAFPPDHPTLTQEQRRTRTQARTRSRTTTEDLMRSFTQKIDLHDPAESISTTDLLGDGAETVRKNIVSFNKVKERSNNGVEQEERSNN